MGDLLLRVIDNPDLATAIWVLIALDGLNTGLHNWYDARQDVSLVEPLEDGDSLRLARARYIWAWVHSAAQAIWLAVALFSFLLMHTHFVPEGLIAHAGGVLAWMLVAGSAVINYGSRHTRREWQRVRRGR